MPNTRIKTSKNVKETRELAKVFLQKIMKNQNPAKGAMVVGLSGDLGAGKTAFTQAVASHLGIKNKVVSPTFVIIKKYPLKKSGQHKFFFHLDAYRLKNEKELLHLGWNEIVANKEHLVFIEWPENVKKAIPNHTKIIHIKIDKHGHRKFS